MHFWVSATRGGFQDGFCCPKKIGTNWFMPALVKRRLGASGKSGDDGIIVCFFSRKNSRNDCLIWAEVMMSKLSATFPGCENYCNPEQTSGPRDLSATDSPHRKRRRDRGSVEGPWQLWTVQ